MMNTQWRERWHTTQWYIETFKIKRLVPLVAILLALWFLGAATIWLAERPWVEADPDHPFGDYSDCLWTASVLLMSELPGEPRSVTGRVTTVFMMLIPAGMLVLVGSHLIASFTDIRRLSRQVRRRLKGVRFSEHVVICGWSEKGNEIVRQLHAEQFRHAHQRRPILIISPDVEAIEIGDADRRAYRGVWGVPEDPTRDEVLREQGDVEHAHSVIVLAPDDAAADAQEADARSILVTLALQSVGVAQKAIVEISQSRNRRHLPLTRVNEIVCIRDVAGRLLAQCAQKHHFTHFFDQMLDVSPETNEVYILPVPNRLHGRPFRVAQHAIGQWSDADVTLVGVRISVAQAADGTPLQDRYGQCVTRSVLTVNPRSRPPDPDTIRTRFFSDEVTADCQVARDYVLREHDRLVVIARQEPDLSKLPTAEG